MLLELRDGFWLDDERENLDLRRVHRYLAGSTYWARGRSLEDMLVAITASARVAGLYRPVGVSRLGGPGTGIGTQVGFARVVSDYVTIAYLCDVYVEEEARGRGFGLELSRFAIEGDARLARLKWALHTLDAHGLYARLGFEPPGERTLERPRAKSS